MRNHRRRCFGLRRRLRFHHGRRYHRRRWRHRQRFLPHARAWHKRRVRISVFAFARVAGFTSGSGVTMGVSG